MDESRSVCFHIVVASAPPGHNAYCYYFERYNHSKARSKQPAILVLTLPRIARSLLGGSTIALGTIELPRGRCSERKATDLIARAHIIRRSESVASAGDLRSEVADPENAGSASSGTRDSYSGTSSDSPSDDALTIEGKGAGAA